MPCSVCQHPQRLEIDRAIIAGSASLTALSQQHGLSTSALSRHRQHLLRQMARAKDRFRDLLREGSLFILNELLAAVWKVARTAEAAGDSRLLLQAARQATGIMKFMAKLDDSLAPETVGLLLASPQLVEAGSLLPTDPQFLVACRQAVAASLFGPCPEPAPVLAEALAAGCLNEAELAELAELDPEELQKLLDELPRDACDDDHHPLKREKGGKKAGKTTQRKNNYLKYQLVNKSAKSTGKSPVRPLAAVNPKFDTPLLSSGNWVKDLDAGRLDIDLLNAIGAGRQPDLAATPFSAR